MKIPRVKSKKIKRILSFAAAVLLFAVSVLSFALITGTEAYAAGAEPFPTNIYDLSKANDIGIRVDDDFDALGAGRVDDVGASTEEGCFCTWKFRYEGYEYHPESNSLCKKREQDLKVNFPKFEGYERKDGLAGHLTTNGHLSSGWGRGQNINVVVKGRGDFEKPEDFSPTDMPAGEYDISEEAVEGGTMYVAHRALEVKPGYIGEGNEYTYIKIYEDPRIPGILFRIVYQEHYYYQYDPNDEDADKEELKEDLALVSKYIKQIKDGNFAPRFMDPDNIKLEWQEPVIYGIEYWKDGWPEEKNNTQNNNGKEDIIVNSTANNEKGKQDGGIIPDNIVNGWKTAKDVLGVIGGIAGGTAAVLGLTGGGNEDVSDDKKKYRMVIYKNFGDTIPRGGVVEVFACIVAMDKNGVESVDLALTRQINIFSHDGTFVIEEAAELSDQYKKAYVQVGTDTPAAQKEGIVSFMFTGEGGTYTNRMTFKLGEVRILFYQENLALPAGYKEHEPVQFTLEGFDPDKVKIEVETSEGSSYEAEYVPSENAPGTYFAILTDTDKSRQEAGTVAESMLYVTARQGETVLTQGLKLLRVNEGLNVSLSALNCYRVLTEKAQGKTVEQLTKDDLVPATTTARAILILYNEEEHTIDQLPILPEFKLEPVDTDPVVKQRVDELGIEAKLTGVEEGSAEVTFFCTKAYLEPPCRFRIKVKASCTYEEKYYECEKEVLMRSQPVRSFQSAEAESIGAKDDKEIERRLNTMLSIIAHNDWEDELVGEVMIARLLLDNYEWCYGYDPLLSYQVLDNFNKFHEEQQRKYLIEQAQAHREADPEKDDFYHELEYRSRFLDSWGGVAVRIGLALGTGGWSEAAFLTLDVNRAVVQYNDATPKEMRTTWGQVKAGAVPVAVWVAFAGAGKVASKVAARVVPKVGAYVSSKIAGSKLLPQSVKNATKNVAKYFAETAEQVKNCEPQKLAERAARAEKAMNSMSLQGEAKAGALLKGMQGDLTMIEKLMEAAQKAGDKEGAALLKELKLAVDTYRISGKAAMTEGALKQNIVKLCQNKYAIEQLIKENPGQADIYRRLITSYRNKLFYDPVKRDSCKYIADMLGCDPKRIKINSVSGKSAEALEKGAAFGHDLDVNFLYENAKGELVELPQAIAEEALYKTSCRHAGIEFKSLAEARKACEKLQIHACQPSDAERLPEVQKLLGDFLRNKALEGESVGKFVNAETYKSVSPFKTGMSQIQKACPDAKTAEKLLNQLKEFQAGRGSLTPELQTVIEGVGNVKEGYRSFSKGCNILKNKAIGADTLGGRSGLTAELHTVDGVAKQIATGKVSVAKGNKLIETMGGFKNNASQCFNQMDKVNGILTNGMQISTGNTAGAVSGAIGQQISARTGGE